MNQLNNGEIGERSSLESKVNDIIQQLEQITKDYDILKPEPFDKLIAELREQIADVVSVEKNMNSIRREIISPVKNELERSSKLGKFSFWGFWIGIIGGILAIISLTFNTFYTKSDPKLQESIKKIIENTANIDSKISTSNNYQTTYNSYLTSDTFKGYIYTNKETIKKGDTFTDAWSGIEIVVSEINSDGTAKIALNIPIKSALGLPGEYKNTLEYYDKVNSGKIWEYECMLGKYNLTIAEINSENNSVQVEIKEIEDILGNID
jgi:formylmethanofuran:tetrahydromethanopterin formyltransferase